MDLKHTRLDRDGNVEAVYRTRVRRLEDGWWMLVGRVDRGNVVTLEPDACEGPFLTKAEAERAQLAIVKAQTTGPGVKTHVNTPAGATLLRRARAVGGHHAGRRQRG